MSYDADRDFFPMERQQTATRPPACAPSMVEAIEQIVMAQLPLPSLR